jgi:two-component system response regulator YesN
MQLLIVDDDQEILNGLKETVNWSQCSIDHVMQADNAEAALAILSADKIDVMITDIKMPGMSGLELAKEVRDRGLDVEIIILSGFADFAYAQLAISYGVVGYVLKPINIEECLHLTNEAVKRKKKSTESVLQENNLLDPNDLKTKLSNIIQGYSSVTSILEKYGDFFCEKDAYVLVVIDILGDILDEYDFQSFEKSIEQCAPRSIILTLNLKRIVVLLRNSASISDIQYLFEELFIEAEMLHSVSIKVGLSDTFFTIKEIRQTYKDVCGEMDRKYFNPDSRFFCKMNLNKSIINNETLLQTYKDMSNSSANLNVKSAKKIFSEIIKELDDYRTAKMIVRAMLGRIERNVALLIEKNRLDEKIKTAYQSVQENWNMLQDQEVVVRLIREKDDEQRKLPKSSKVNLVQRVKEYVQQHYNEEADIATIARYLQKNENYLSHTFREVNGQTFCEYLNAVRIENAKRMLLDTNDTIFSISKDVGYSDEKYFMKLFLKYFGMTPTQFRNANRR